MHDVRLHGEEILKRQLDLAAEVQLPVIIHNREATGDVLRILLEWQHGLEEDGHPLAGRPGVLHSFSADESAAEKAMAANFMIGITGPVTFKNAPKLQALVEKLPLEYLLIETDAPYLTPHPFRGKRNEPARVRLVAPMLPLPIARISTPFSLPRRRPNGIPPSRNETTTQTRFAIDYLSWPAGPGRKEAARINWKWPPGVDIRGPFGCPPRRLQISTVIIRPARRIKAVSRSHCRWHR